jgi:hypothetical protein
MYLAALDTLGCKPCSAPSKDTSSAQRKSSDCEKDSSPRSGTSATHSGDITPTSSANQSSHGPIDMRRRYSQEEIASGAGSGLKRRLSQGPADENDGSGKCIQRRDSRIAVHDGNKYTFVGIISNSPTYLNLILMMTDSQVTQPYLCAS